MVMVRVMVRVRIRVRVRVRVRIRVVGLGLGSGVGVVVGGEVWGYLRVRAQEPAHTSWQHGEEQVHCLAPHLALHQGGGGQLHHEASLLPHLGRGGSREGLGLVLSPHTWAEGGVGKAAPGGFSRVVRGGGAGVRCTGLEEVLGCTGLLGRGSDGVHGVTG